MTLGARELLPHTAQTTAAARVWELAVESTDPLERSPRGLWCEVAGTITVEDAEGNELDFTVESGPVPISPTKILTITDATVYLLY